MSDQPSQQPGLPPTNVLDTISQAHNISWERNQSILAKNQFAFTGPAQPVQFKFNTPNQPSSSANASPATPSIPTPTNSNTPPPSTPSQPPIVLSVQQPPPMQHTQPNFAIAGTPMPAAIQPAQSPTPSNLAPVPVGNFGKWAAYFNPNPSVNRPYFYCHGQSLTTYDCPQEIQPEFAPQFATFLQNYRASNPQAPVAHKLGPPPPGFATLNRTNSALLMGSIPPPHNIAGNQVPGMASPALPPPSGLAGTPVLPVPPQNPPNTSFGLSQPPPHPGPPPKPVVPLPITPSHSVSHPPPFTPANASHRSDTGSVVGLQVDPDGPALSLQSQGTVADLTPHHVTNPSFSFHNEHISNPNPLHLPQLPPKYPPQFPTHLTHSASTGARHFGSPLVEDMPDQHPLATIIAARPSQCFSTSISLPPIKASLLSIPNENSPSTFPPMNGNTPSHASSLGLPSNSSFAYADLSTPFAELLKVDALPTQKDGTFLKLTTGFRKSWRQRYVILHQGAFRWWDDIESAKKQMSSPNAIVSIVGCVAQLPPIGSHVPPKNGLLIDGNVGGMQEILDKYENSQDYEQASFFIRSEQIGEVDSWMHILYRNGIIDGRYVLNPDLTKSCEGVVAQTHRCFETWSRERVAASNGSFGANEISYRDLPTESDLRTSTKLPIISTDFSTTIGTVPELASPRSLQQSIRPGMYVAGGLYSYQPTPIPVHVNGKKRPSPCFAILFTDHIECYETYDDASLVCRYHNPDVNMTINAETLHDKPKILYRIPITRDTEIHIERSTVSSTYNEHSIIFKVKENRYRGIKKQEWSLAFEECNPATGHPQVISTPSWQAQNLPPAETPGTSLSVAQKWFYVMEYCLEGPLAGTFGTTLWWSITRSTIPLPLVLHTCFRFISQKGLQEEGILRVPGNNQDIMRLRRSFDACQTDATLTDPNTAAGLFKLFLRENQDGLIPRSMYKVFTSNNCRAAGSGAAAEKRAPCVAVLKTLVAQLPILNQICLAYVIHILSKIASYASVNKMFPKNCAMVLAPNLFRPSKPPNAQGLLSNAKDDNTYASAQQMAEALAEQEAIILIFIEHFTEIFLRGSPYP